MIIVMKPNATRDQIEAVTAWVEANQCRVHLSQGEERTIVGVIGNDRPLDRDQAERLDGVEKIVPILAPYKLASRDMQPAPTLIPLNGLKVGGSQISLVAQYADVLQIGARNMQNYNLLKAAGQVNMPVLLKRGMMNTMEELLMSAEYILSCGNGKVMLCERGIRAFETYTRNTFDINAIPALKMRSHLPVIADPSHATGHWEIVGAAALAAVAAGADGLLIEVHPHPEQARSDGLQSLKPERFAELVTRLRAVAGAVGRTIQAR